MKTLFDMMQDAQNGLANEQFASQFGLNQQQAEKAIEALMPAFSTGLKRNTADPMGFASFMDALSSGQHAKYAEDAAAAFSPNGVNEGNAILSHLFGSKEVSRAVAANAAQVSGIGESILKQMLPVLAPMVMGGLFKQMSGQKAQTSQFGGMGNNPLGQIFEQMTGSRRSGGSGNPLQDILGQMMGGGQNTGRGGGSGNPLEDLLGQMMGGSRPQRDTGQSGSGGRESDNPLGNIFEEMLRGNTGNRGQSPRAEAPREPDPYDRDHDRDEFDAEQERARRNQPGGGLGDLFGEMFESGRKVQKDYQRNIDSIFDQYLEGMKRR